MCKSRLESENPNLMQNLVKSYFSLLRQINFNVNDFEEKGKFLPLIINKSQIIMNLCFDYDLPSNAFLKYLNFKNFSYNMFTPLILLLTSLPCC